MRPSADELFAAAADDELTSLFELADDANDRGLGLFDGLEPDGALRLRLADGSPRVIHAGDVMLGGT